MKPGRNTPDTNSAIAERARFQKRLLQALRDADYTRSPTALAARFNAKFPDVQITANAARKWLLGESIPRQEKLRILADILDVTSDWLRFGTEAAAREFATSPGAAIIANIVADIETMEKPLQCLTRDIIRALLAFGKAYPIAPGACEAANG
ncbi:transcriptional regulator [Janthinobacterium sp. CG3]|uniref:transcriptional regulator n=1 Tax=Janthinobacterium sp. CG3 TaxID=1075768 RepID=UPI0003739A18|nr:transcriptional regulator [Janthinobacterium sp. CG3]